jgi:phage terminase large subunit-like protein
VIPGRKWSDEYWCIDLEFAGISIVGQEAFSICCAGLKGAIVSKRCLVGETLVRTDQGDYPIETFNDRIGGKVLTLDEASQSLVWRSVIGCESHESSDIVQVQTAKGVLIKCTSDHPFYVAGEGFVDAAKLKSGALICSIDADNNLLQADHIVSVNKIEGSELVYDIEVEGTHNFFANGVCVHNSHLILLDDLVKSEFDIANPEIREQMEQNWTRSILPTMFDGGRAICLGTRFRADDIHCSTFTPENGWIQIEQSAIIDDEESEGGEKSYWDFWSLGHLQGIRALDPIGFSFQYQNKIVRTTEVSIHPDWIIKSPVHRDIRRYEQIGIGVDLSSKTKERHDFTVMVLGGRLNNRYYILDMWRGRVAGNKSKLEHLLELCYAWDIIDSSGKYYLGTDINCYLYVEDVAYQASLKGDFQTYVVNELSIHNLIYRPIFAKGDKLSKLRSVTGLFENELVRFNDQAKLGAAIEELVSFGATAHDDCADAIELLLNGLRSSAPLEVLYG